MLPDYVIHAELEVKGCTAELYVNGIPIRRLDGQALSAISFPVHQYLITGTNELEILVEPGPTPSLARITTHSQIPSGEAVGRLVSYPDGAFTELGNGEILAHVEFQGNGKERHVFPRSFSRQLELAELFGRWDWQDAPALSLDEATIAEALALLNEVAGALSSGSVDAVLDLIEVCYREGRRAYPSYQEEMLRAELREFLGSLKRVPSPIVPPSLERIDFRLVAQGRILECIDKDWRPSIRLLNEDGVEVPYRLLLARIGRRLRIVR